MMFEQSGTNSRCFGVTGSGTEACNLQIQLSDSLDLPR